MQIIIIRSPYNNIKVNFIFVIIDLKNTVNMDSIIPSASNASYSTSFIYMYPFIFCVFIIVCLLLNCIYREITFQLTAMYRIAQRKVVEVVSEPAANKSLMTTSKSRS